MKAGGSEADGGRTAGGDARGGADSIERVAVLGAGTMGHGIAQVCASVGCRVTLYDIDVAAAEAGVRKIAANLEKGVALGKVEPGDSIATLARVAPGADLPEAVDGADLVIEAAPESMEIKTGIFRAVEAAAGEGALIASNTSSLSIDDLAAVLKHPGRFLGLHFFNPVHIMGLVEIVHGSRTAPRTLDRGIAFVKRLGKEPVVVKDSPGFASSRLGIALGLEAMRMVEEGVADAQSIDRAMELGYRHPMGPLKLTDLVGLDVRLGIAEYLHETLGTENFRPPEILRKKVAEGKLGKKSGEGFYRWDEEGR